MTSRALPTRRVHSAVDIATPLIALVASVVAFVVAGQFAAMHLDWLRLVALVALVSWIPLGRATSMPRLCSAGTAARVCAWLALAGLWLFRQA